MSSRRRVLPTEIVIWVSAGALALVLGVGCAFALWNQLHHTAQPTVLDAAVVLLGLGLALVALGVPKTMGRVFLAVFATALLGGFFLATPAFASIGF